MTQVKSPQSVLFVKFEFYCPKDGEEEIMFKFFRQAYFSRIMYIVISIKQGTIFFSADAVGMRRLCFISRKLAEFYVVYRYKSLGSGCFFFCFMLSQATE